MIVYVFASIIVGACGYIGWSIGHHYKEREKLFFELTSFCSYIDSNISFFQKTLSEIIEGFESDKQKSELKKILDKFLYSLGEEKPFDIQLALLRANEKKTIENFLQALGKTDAYTQKENICHYKAVFEGFALDAKKEMQKFGGMSTKLGVFCGLAIAICFL